MLGHDRYGASWEGFALEQVARVLQAGEECYFWRTHAGSEVDLVIPRGSDLFGFEFKCSTSPGITRGTHEAVADLGLKKLFVIHPGEHEFDLTDKIKALPLNKLNTLIHLVS